jgi:hypothetical protein
LEETDPQGDAPNDHSARAYFVARRKTMNLQAPDKR